MGRRLRRLPASVQQQQLETLLVVSRSARSPVLSHTQHSPLLPATAHYQSKHHSIHLGGLHSHQRSIWHPQIFAAAKCLDGVSAPFFLCACNEEEGAATGVSDSARQSWCHQSWRQSFLPSWVLAKCEIFHFATTFVVAIRDGPKMMLASGQAIAAAY